MRQYDLTAVHDAVGNAYTKAQNLEDEEFREEMIAGVIDVARQVRAAEEMEGVSEAAEALEYGAEGMADVYIKEQTMKKHAQEYRELMDGMIDDESSIASMTSIGGAGGVQASSKMVEQLEKEAEQLEELTEETKYAESTQRDAFVAEGVAEETANAYGRSFGVLLEEYEELQEKVASDLVEGDEDMSAAFTALEEINPGEEEIKL